MATEAPPRPPTVNGRPAADAEVSPSVPFPRYSIALVQNESEMLQAPSYDIHIFLERDPVFDVELYTERSVRALPGESARFDCVVIGYNAAHKSEVIREALKEQSPTTGLCVLHQLDPEALSFLEPQVALRRFADAEAGVHMARGREPQDDVLLNWPQAVSLDADGVLAGARAYGGLEPGSDTRWRAVLEAEHQGGAYPVLLRSPVGGENQIVVCSALLSQARPTHAALLRNMITWCAAGRPDVVVVEAPGDTRSPFLHRKLRLQGAKAVAHEVESEDELDFGRWPFHGVANVILPSDWAQKATSRALKGVGDWLDRDGRIVSLERDGNLVIRHGASDTRWVASQWTGWFTSIPPATWHGDRPANGSIVRTRAVLRAMIDLRRGVDDATAKRLGMPRPSEFAAPCAELLKARLGRAGTNIDGTVSTTTAALEIDKAVGGKAINRVQQLGIVRWLRDRARERDEDDRPVLAAEDRLEIARCLSDGDLTREVARDLAGELRDAQHQVGSRQEIAAILVTKLREAVVTGGLAPADVPVELKSAPRSVELDVRESPLLAANYLIAWSEIRDHWEDSPHDPLVDETAAAIDRVIISIGKHGLLVSGRAAAVEHPHELMSAEALALRTYFDRHEAATHMLPGAGQTPPDILTALVDEARDLRQRNTAIPGLERAVFWGKWIVGLLAVALVVGASFLVDSTGFTLPVFPDLTIPGVAVAVLLAESWALNKVGLLAEWLNTLTGWVGERAGLSRSEKSPEQQPKAPEESRAADA